MKNNSLQSNIVKDILDIANKAASNALQAVNTQLVIRNWLIGKRISEEILTTRSNDYGKKIIKNLSNELHQYGKGFDRANLYRYLLFYKIYKKIFSPVGRQSIKHILPWTHYRILIYIKNDNERKWYEEQIFNCGWSKRQLERNIKTDMYNRIIAHQTNNNLKQLISIENNDCIKSLMVLEFLGFKKDEQYKELDLQKSLETNMSKFLLELGRGYTFAGRQIHLRTNNNDYFVDLVFYNTILKRYLLIDLKVGKIQHKDIGQMSFYLDLFDKQNNIDEANKSIGMILSSDLNSDIVHYLMNNKDNYVVASKYLTYLPTKEEIRKEIEKIYK